MPATEMKKKVASAVDELLPPTVSLLTDMIRLDSSNPPGNYVPIAELVAAGMKRFGLEAEVIESDQHEDTHRQPPRINVVGGLVGEESSRSLTLCGHLDTVPVEDPKKWSVDPFGGVIKDGRIWGRGATDCKGRLASYILAAASLVREGIKLGGDLVLAATADEETGGHLGAKYLLDSGKLRSGPNHYAILEGYSDCIFYAYKGHIELKITAHGRSAHFSRPWKGVNAIEYMAKAILALVEFENELKIHTSPIFPDTPYPTLVMSVIGGGKKTTIVPDRCELCAIMGFLPDQNPQELLAEVKTRIDSARRGNLDITFETELLSLTPPIMSSKDSPLVASLQNALQEVASRSVPVIGSPGGGDMRWFVEKGTCSVAFGAGYTGSIKGQGANTRDSRIHGVDENLELDNLSESAKVVAIAAMNLMGARR